MTTPILTELSDTVLLIICERALGRHHGLGGMPSRPPEPERAEVYMAHYIAGKLLRQMLTRQEVAR